MLAFNDNAEGQFTILPSAGVPLSVFKLVSGARKKSNAW